MSTVTGQLVQKHAMEAYKQGSEQLRSQLNLEVKHAKEVQQNKGYATRSHAPVSKKIRIFNFRLGILHGLN
jgi:hypothetical protein